jgi:hypothetical protein
MQYRKAGHEVRRGRLLGARDAAISVRWTEPELCSTYHSIIQVQPDRVQPCGTASEIYKFHHDTLTPHALAASRLAIPISTVSTHRAADKLKAQNDAHDRERKDRADRLNGIVLRGTMGVLDPDEGAGTAGLLIVRFMVVPI